MELRVEHQQRITEQGRGQMRAEDWAQWRLEIEDAMLCLPMRSNAKSAEMCAIPRLRLSVLELCIFIFNFT